MTTTTADELMATRYIGDAVIRIRYRDCGDYAGSVSAGGHVWHFDRLYVPPGGFGAGIAYGSDRAYDEMAAAAVRFAAAYVSAERHGDIFEPDGVPSAEVADAIAHATTCAADDRGEINEMVRRVR